MALLGPDDLEKLFAAKLNDAAVRMSAAIKKMRAKEVKQLPLNVKQAQGWLDAFSLKFIENEVERKLDLYLQGQLRVRKPTTSPNEEK